MASFCRSCAMTMWGYDDRDLAGITTPEGIKNDRWALALCECCGPVQINEAGSRIHERDPDPRSRCDCYPELRLI